MKAKEATICLDNSGTLTTQGSGKVSINTVIEIIGSGTELPVTITADFSKVPEHLHSLYLDALQSQYRKDISIYDNTENVSKAEVQPKWYEHLFNLT